MIAARRYQREAIDAVAADLAAGLTRVAVVLPTGTGKTCVFSILASEYVERGNRVLVLVHRDELAQQAKDKLLSVNPDLKVGIVKAESNEVDADVVIGSVQTLAREARREQITGVGLVIADECHRASARTWMEVMEHFGCFGWGDESADPHDAPPERSTPAVGFTATMTRADGRGLGNVWEKVSYERTIDWAIEMGFLCDVRGQAVEIDGFSLADIARSRGDYVDGQLGSAMEEIGAGEVIARAYAEHCRKPDGSYRRGVMFTPTVSSAYTFADDMRASGIRAEGIDGTTSIEDRRLLYKKFEQGEIDVLANAMLLVEGWDAPWAEVCVMARPTQNPGLYTQAVGRVLRPFPGKTEALVLDVVGIAGHHRLQSLTTLTKVSVEPGESLVEAQERAEREHFEVERQRLEAPHLSREVELFSASHSVWLQTKAGVWFVPTKAGIYFLWPEPGGKVKLGYKRSGRGVQPRSDGWVFDTPMELTYGMAHGESLAEADDPTVALRDRAWRKQRPSAAQLDLAAKLRVGDISEMSNWRRGAVSDALSIHVASRLLDKFVESVA